MTFETSGDAYESYMGRYSRPLAAAFADWAGIGGETRALDVGCGPGALGAELVRRLGATAVAAADPSRSFAAACAERLPGVDVRIAPAERLPWPDGSFDVALSQLVVNFMADAGAGIAEMARVTRPGGTVAACTWDYAEGMRMLRVFWDGALAIDPSAPDESETMRFQDAAELRRAWESAGLERIETGALVVEARYDDFDDFWEPFLLGVGPGGAYCVSLGEADRAALREECRRRVGSPPGAFTLSARAWAVRGSVPAQR